MVDNNTPRGIRSRTERSRAGDTPASVAGEAVSNQPARESTDESTDESSGDLAALRETAQGLGYQLRRESHRRRPRPELKEGRISTTIRLTPEVRDALDNARMLLNLSFSDMINAGVIMFIESQNLRVDARCEDFVPSPAKSLPSQ